MASERARALRKTMTPPEVVMWARLRDLKARGWHFRRQAPEGPYNLDFVCRRAKLVVEIDGIQHANAGQSSHDERRDAFLEARGFTVLRFWASDVATETDNVAETILNALGQAHPTRQPTLKLRLTPSPQGEGGRYIKLIGMGRRRRANTD